MDQVLQSHISKIIMLDVIIFDVIPKKVGHFKCACLPVGRDFGLRLPHIKSKLSQSVRSSSQPAWREAGDHVP